MDRRKWASLISWLWPLSVAQQQGRFGPLEVRFEQGRQVLNSAHGNQSFGSLHRVWQGAFSKAGVVQQAPKSVLLLGLGGGSVVHILRKELSIAATITAVELDPVMIELARAHFGLDTWSDLQVLEGDATIQVHALPERYDLVVVDLFDDLDLARGVDANAFIHGLRERCSEGGATLFNTVTYDALSSARCDRVRAQMTKVFNSVEEFHTEDVNKVFIAR